MLSSKFLSQIENGHVNPSIGVLGRIIHDGLGLTFGVVFTWEPPHGEVSSVVALLAAQPVEHRKRLLRVIEVLCEEPIHNAAKSDSQPRSRRREKRR